MMSKRHQKRERMNRRWRHGPRYQLVPKDSRKEPPKPATVWLIWDNESYSYVGDPIQNEARAKTKVQQLNEEAGYPSG